MIGKLFYSRKQRQPNRPSVRPMLESLENREVPSAASVSAVYDQFPTDVNNLVASLQARPADVNAINANLSTVASDVFTLKLGAPIFMLPDRFQIDNALVVNGIMMFYQAFNNYPFIPAAQFVQTARLGSSAVEAGILDFVVAGLYPQTTGDGVLT
jgi:hypothetical protein